MANAKEATYLIRTQRAQVADAVLQGFLDSVVAADLGTAKTNGYIPGQKVDAFVDTSPIGGINR